jgi:toxin ParE1/3/4
VKAFRVHRLARWEISEAFRYYQATDDPSLAHDFQQKLRVAFQEIRRNPMRFSRWKGTRVRKYILRRFPYLIFYIDYPECIRIYAIAHTSRRPGYWKSRIAVD